MFDGLFGNVNLLQKGLDASWLKNEIISHNISNVDTPNFKAQKVEFESVFRKALEGGGLKVTNSKHIAGKNGSKLAPIISEKTGVTRMDGNNVDIEGEMAELASNSIHYNYMLQKVSKEFAMLKTAIKEG